MIGYIFLLITYDPWVVMISKVLSRFYVGAELTIGMAYFAEISVDYTRVIMKLGRKAKFSYRTCIHVYKIITSIYNCYT